MREADISAEPWYRNPWVWLIIAIPGLTVIGCAFTIYLAIANPEIILSNAHSSPIAVAAMAAAAGISVSG